MTKHKPHPAPNQPNRQDEQREIPGDVHVSGDIQIDFPPDVKKDNSAARQKDTTREKVKIWIEGVTLLIVLVYTFVAFVQWRAMLDSNKISHDALESVQRAFISLKDVQGERRIFINPGYTIGPESGPAGPGRDLPRTVPSARIPVWDMEAVLENSGATPAINLITQSFFTTREDEPPGNAFKDGPNETPPISTTMGPKATQIVSRGIFPVTGMQLFVSPFDEQDVSKIIVNQKFFAWGWIIYRDIFSDSDTHLTEFCQHLASIRKPPTGGYDLVFANCKSHNCVDRNCQDYEYVMKTLVKRQ